MGMILTRILMRSNMYASCMIGEIVLTMSTAETTAAIELIIKLFIPLIVIAVVLEVIFGLVSEVI